MPVAVLLEAELQIQAGSRVLKPTLVVVLVAPASSALASMVTAASASGASWTMSGASGTPASAPA